MTRVLILGRFQPPHRGHVAAIRQAARGGRSVVVVVGSAQESGTLHNPFSAEERLRMLRAALREAKLRGVRIVAVADLNDYPNWVAHVERLAPRFDEVLTNNPLTKRLFRAAGYPVRTGRLVNRDWYRATRIRTRLAAGRDISDAVPDAVVRILTRIGARDRVRRLVEGRASGPG